MESPRLAGGTLTTFLPSMTMAPPVTSSRPAIRRSSVVLPQPDGPTNVEVAVGLADVFERDAPHDRFLLNYVPAPQVT
jgi:hypothetical protein